MSDGWTAWTLSGDVVGSMTLSGGRALSGQFHHDNTECRVWRREVASADGTLKAVLHIWYRGEQRLGAVYGTLAFDPRMTSTADVPDTGDQGGDRDSSGSASSGGDRFGGAWLVLEYVFDPDGAYRGSVTQRRRVEPVQGDRFRVSQSCVPSAELDSPPHGGFRR